MTSDKRDLSRRSYRLRILHVDGKWKTHDLVKAWVEPVCPGCELITSADGVEALRLVNGAVRSVIVDPWAPVIAIDLESSHDPDASQAFLLADSTDEFVEAIAAALGRE